LDHVCAFNDDALVDADYSQILKSGKHAITLLDPRSDRVRERVGAGQFAYFFSGLEHIFRASDNKGVRNSLYIRLESYCDTLPHRDVAGDKCKWVEVRIHEIDTRMNGGNAVPDRNTATEYLRSTGKSFLGSWSSCGDESGNSLALVL
jgi:hypothetical protein